MTALVDDADFDYLNQWWWNANEADDGFYYAARTESGRVIRMHREIMQAPDNVLVDHRDGNGLNNQRYNLRMATNRQNAMNRKGANKNNASGYRNVVWIGSYWRVQLQVNGTNHMFPEKFVDVHEAGRFAKKMREEYYGEFAGQG